MRKNIFILVTLILLLISLIGCGKKNSNSKNMEQIQKEEGIPVRIKEIKPSVYLESYSYNAALSGIEESKVTAPVGDVISKINIKVGDYVQKDQIVLTFPQDTPAAMYKQANSAFLNAKSTYERMQRLFAQGAVSQQDLDNVETGFKVAQANYNSAQNMINVKAPISGFITNLFVNAGDNVASGNDLFTVSNTSKYKAVIWVPASEIQKIKKGQKAIAKWNDEILTGYITSVAMAMDQNSKAFRVEILFNSKTKYIASGVTVEINIEVLRVPNTIIIDRKSVIEIDGKLFVWVVENNKAVKKEIQTRHTNGIEYEVSSGLSEGDKLIVEGMTMVYDDALVKVVQ